ncbi:mitochondrial chaperone [Sporothrix brasiliensis 5110]|uniref:ferroxidase n=1 Tax=Sporothrix brasiliensis 5110 TaxID=1398154 RepID=A0A0C2IWI6_9PEZI|nr:mitochondrial chaperone [Sporothrix brasiliensis 5110]KIH93516.1 mitochondrial chaperone [Sporothrix brasiliensis 5110]
MPRPAHSASPRIVRRLAAAAGTPASTRPLISRCACRQHRHVPLVLLSIASRRFVSSTSPAPIRPTAARFAQPPQAAAPFLSAYTPQSAVEPAGMTESEYHALADEYLDRLLVRLEDMQDAREDVDVEYASGVLTLSFSPSEPGARPRTYVINKQPPNKQIWLSSPISGPKRYDWVLDAGTSGDSTRGQWIYLKDGSALNDLLRDEIDLDLDAEWEEA